MNPEPNWKTDLLLGAAIIVAALALLFWAWRYAFPHQPVPDPTPPQVKGLLISIDGHDISAGCVAWRPTRADEWRLLCLPNQVYPADGVPRDERSGRP